MNTFRTISRVLIVTTVIFAHHANAGENKTWKSTKKYTGNATNFAYKLPYGQYVLVNAVDKQFNSPHINAATATGYKILQQTQSGSGEIHHIHNGMYFVINDGVRQATQYSAKNGYDIEKLISHSYDNVVGKGEIRNTVKKIGQELAPVVKEATYDIITAVLLSGGKIAVAALLSSIADKASTQTNTEK